MPGEFDGKIVVISGASRGIGRGIALAFARAGAQTVLASSSAENLALAAKAIAAEGPEPFTVAGDLRTLEACERLFASVNERFRRCDVLVNNAGATRAGAFLDLPDAAWLDGYALKLFGGVRLTRLFWPRFWIFRHGSSRNGQRPVLDCWRDRCCAAMFVSIRRISPSSSECLASSAGNSSTTTC